MTCIQGSFKGLPATLLSRKRREIFFEVLFSIKVPTGFSSNIKEIVNMKDKIFQNLKSHDCHVLMTQLLLVALRGILPKNVRLAIVKVCAFLNAISQKVIDRESLLGLQIDVVQCLVSFELLFDAGRITTQLGTLRGRYDEHSSKSFPQ
jgi:hypothetical protein